jgi:hypothetical protein
MKVILNGKEYPVPAKFNWGEIIDAERYFDVDFTQASGRTINGRTIAAMMYFAIKRVDANITVEDIRNMDPEDFEMIEDEVDAGPPSLPPPDEKPSGSSETSGESSPNGGVDPAAIQAPIGLQS